MMSNAVTNARMSADRRMDEMNVKKSAVKKIVPAAAATPEAGAKTVTPKAEKVTNIKASKYKGVTTGMRVMEYQDSTFAAQSKAMLTDEELAANWRAEFPEAVAFTPGHVAGARRDYNAGRHSKAFQKPAAAVGAFVLVNGKRVAASAVEVAPKAKTPAPAPAPAPALAPAPAKASAPAKAAPKTVARRPLARAS